MVQYSKYQKKNGQTAWKFRAYAGINPQTGKQAFINRSNFSSKKEAQLCCNRLLVQIQNEGFQKKTDNTFQEVYELWLKNYKLTVKESSYVKLLQKFDKHILPCFGDKPIKKITVLELQNFANHMREINTQYKEYISNISRIFEYAIKLDLLDHNPVKKITIPKKKKNLSSKEVNFFTKEELKTFLDYTQNNESTKIYTFFYLMANTGARTGELCGLQWSQIDFERNTLEIRQTLSRGQNRKLYLEEPKTKNSRRTIPLNASTMNLLKKWRAIQRTDMLQLGFNTMKNEQLVFANLENGFIQLTQPRLWMQRITKRSGLPNLSPHSLRHTFATLLIGQGVNFKTVSELLGHSSVSMTLDTYSGVYQEAKTETINLLEKVLN